MWAVVTPAGLYVSEVVLHWNLGVSNPVGFMAVCSTRRCLITSKLISSYYVRGDVVSVTVASAGNVGGKFSFLVFWNIPLCRVSVVLGVGHVLIRFHIFYISGLWYYSFPDPSPIYPLVTIVFSFSVSPRYCHCHLMSACYLIVFSVMSILGMVFVTVLF